MIQISNNKQYDLEERCFKFAKRVNEYIKIPSRRTESLMDPGRLALPSPLTKGSILLHEIQARVRINIIKFKIKTKAFEKSKTFIFGKRRPVFHTNSAFYPHYINPLNLVKGYLWITKAEPIIATSTEPYNLEERTAKFGENIIKFCRSVKSDMITASLISQLIRSATSIGANYMEVNVRS